MKRTLRIAATCEAVRDDLCRVYRARPDRVDVIPPGVGSPFDRWSLSDLDSREGSYCIAVGAHDLRKNIAWLFDWWPAAFEELGLRLVVTTKGKVPARLPQRLVERAGIEIKTDPDDDELAQLYSEALCLLWPSLYEGFGLPLLEAMAVGTPFISNDTGAASELAVEAQQVLPLDSAMWIEQLRKWHSSDLQELRGRSAAAARMWTYEQTAESAAKAIALAG